MKNQNDDILVTRTQEWELEWPILINFNSDDECVIECGGAEMPRYKVTGESLPDAIRELVKEVTRDAIADEAREWSNDTAHTQKGRERGPDSTQD